MVSVKRRRRRTWIALVVLAGLPLLFLVAYLVAARWLLSGPKLREAINATPVEMKIDWDEAVSKWPGRVTVKNLSIRGSDPNVEWIVTIPQATLRFALLPLLKKTFQVTELRPKSLQFRLRQKVPPAQANAPQVKWLPPIPGFSDPPLREEGVTTGPPPSNPFTIHLLDIATDTFDDIWVDGYRYRGKAALRGRFKLTPGHRAQIGPASITFPGGRLDLGDAPMITELKGKLEATFDSWDVQALQGDAVWKVVTAKAEIAGPTGGIEFLEGALRLGPQVHLTGGPGQFSLSIALDHGKGKGEIGITAKNGKYARPRLTLVGSVAAKLKIRSWTLDGGEMDIGGSSLKLTDVSVPGSGAKRGWWGDFEIPSGRLGKGLTGKITAKARDGRPILAVLGEGLPKWTSGLIELEDLTASADVVLSEPRTSVRGFAAAGGKFKIQGDYDRRGASARGAFLIENGLLVVGVELDNGKAVLHPILGRQWFEKSRATGFDPPRPPGAAKPEPKPKPDSKSSK